MTDFVLIGLEVLSERVRARTLFVMIFHILMILGNLYYFLKHSPIYKLTPKGSNDH